MAMTVRGCLDSGLVSVGPIEIKVLTTAEKAITLHRVHVNNCKTQEAKQKVLLRLARCFPEHSKNELPPYTARLPQ